MGVKRPRRRFVLPMAFLGLVGAYACTPDSPSREDLASAVVRMEQPSNEERRAALTGILTELGVEWELDPFEIRERSDYPRTHGANVVATMGEGESDIVVGAHFDAVWLADGTLSRGAVDNAASSVILTHVARALQSADLDHRVRIVWFDMEEIGRLGSTHFAANNDRPIAAVINLDVNGYGDTLFYGPAPESDVEVRMQEWIADGCIEFEVSCLAFGRYPASDYQSFREAGIPAVSLSVLPRGEAEELRSFLNPVPGAGPRPTSPTILALIHTAEDTSARIDPDGMLLTYAAVLELVDRLDHE